MKPHPILTGFEDSRIARFVFDQPRKSDEALLTFILKQDGRQRVLRFTVPAANIESLGLLGPPAFEIQDDSDEGWETETIEVVHPHSGHTYFYASKVEEIAVPDA
jgi:hypothetical protein